MIYVVSQLSSTYFMSAGATMPKAQRYLLFALPIIFIPFIVNFPSGLMIYWLTTNLWTTGQGLVTRRMMPRPDLTAEKKSSRTPPKEPPPDAGNGSKRKGVPRRRGLGHRGGRATAQGAPEALRRRQAEMSEEVSVEATGETVGEAKWAAIRELEQLLPGVERDDDQAAGRLRGRAGPARRRLHAGSRDRVGTT